MLKTYELVQETVRYHVINEIGNRSEMSEYERNNLADSIVDYIAPDGNLEYVSPYTLQRMIGEQSPNVRLGDLIKDMVRRELWDYTITAIRVALLGNESE